MARSPETPLGQFLAAHSQLQLGELGTAIGEADLTGKIRRVQKSRALLRPEVLDKIAEHLDPAGQRMLVAMMAREARLPGHTPETDISDDGHLSKVITQVEDLTRRERFDLIIWLVRSVERTEA